MAHITMALPHAGLIIKKSSQFKRRERAILTELTRMNTGIDGQPRATNTTYWGAAIPVAPCGGDTYPPMLALVHRGTALADALAAGHIINEPLLRRNLATAIEALADIGYVHADIGVGAWRNITFDTTTGQYYLIDFGTMRPLAEHERNHTAEQRQEFIDAFVNDVICGMKQYAAEKGDKYKRAFAPRIRFICH